MFHLEVISPSIRKGRKSHRAALYIQSFINDSSLASAGIIDLLDYNFPLFDERLKYQEHPTERMLDFAAKVKLSDGVIIISPEYNGAPPASLKNAVDLLTGEWKRKPVALIPVSDGKFAGTQAVIPLQFALWKLGAITIPAMFRIPEIESVFDENGRPADKQLMDKRSLAFLNEILWYIEAGRRMDESPEA